jgi:hypothetical protein
MNSKASVTKACLSCGQTKPLEDFHRSPVSRDGRAARCKSCRNAGARTYRQRRRKAESAAEERGRERSRNPRLSRTSRDYRRPRPRQDRRPEHLEQRSGLVPCRASSWSRSPLRCSMRRRETCEMSVELAYVYREVISTSSWSGTVGRRKLCARLLLNDEQREVARGERVRRLRDALRALASVPGGHGRELF